MYIMWCQIREYMYLRKFCVKHHKANQPENFFSQFWYITKGQTCFTSEYNIFQPLFLYLPYQAVHSGNLPIMWCQIREYMYLRKFFSFDFGCVETCWYISVDSLESSSSCIGHPFFMCLCTSNGDWNNIPVSDLWGVSGFLRILRFPPPIKLTASI
jgi:hypothetical protein